MTLNKLRLNANEKGFTLIELMIVIAIIGILAAIAIPNYIAYRDKAYCSAAESDAQAAASSLADYFSIPSNQAVGLRTNVTVLTLGTSTEGIRMSGAGTTQNQLTITPPAAGESSYGISVIDKSTRCPVAYRTNAAKWSKEDAGGTYSITL